VNDSVAEIQTRDDALRGIELNHATHVDGERGQAFELEIERKRAQTGGGMPVVGTRLSLPLLKLMTPGRTFPNMPHLSKRFPTFTPKSPSVIWPSLPLAQNWHLRGKK